MFQAVETAARQHYTTMRLLPVLLVVVCVGAVLRGCNGTHQEPALSRAHDHTRLVVQSRTRLALSQAEHFTKAAVELKNAMAAWKEQPANSAGHAVLSNSSELQPRRSRSAVASAPRPQPPTTAHPHKHNQSSTMSHMDGATPPPTLPHSRRILVSLEQPAPPSDGEQESEENGEEDGEEVGEDVGKEDEVGEETSLMGSDKAPPGDEPPAGDGADPIAAPVTAPAPAKKSTPEATNSNPIGSSSPPLSSGSTPGSAVTVLSAVVAAVSVLGTLLLVLVLAACIVHNRRRDMRKQEATDSSLQRTLSRGIRDGRPPPLRPQRGVSPGCAGAFRHSPGSPPRWMTISSGKPPLSLAQQSSGAQCEAKQVENAPPPPKPPVAAPQNGWQARRSLSEIKHVEFRWPAAHAPPNLSPREQGASTAQRSSIGGGGDDKQPHEWGKGNTRTDEPKRVVERVSTTGRGGGGGAGAGKQLNAWGEKRTTEPKRVGDKATKYSALQLASVSNTYMSQGNTTVVSLNTTDARPWKPRTEPPELPLDTSLKSCLKFMHQQLDCFGDHNPLLGRFLLLGSEERRRGGSALVQFARSKKGTGLRAYALKFFAYRETYNSEAHLYQSFPAELRRFMPTIVRFVPNEDCKHKDPFGSPLPPFIVMEKGESLQDRARNCRVDVFTAAQVLGHISQRIAELHDVGYAHRDLKPGNIMWQPRTYNWVLIDFGLTARIGERSRIGCTPNYAAPETVLALQHAQSTVFAELSHSRSKLPWEDGRISSRDIKKMGMFREAILKLLRRDPSKRATVHQFCKDLTNIFERQTETLSNTQSRFPENSQDSEIPNACWYA